MVANDDVMGDVAPTGEEALAGDTETWEPWETWLVTSSVAIGVLALFLLGWLVNRFILSS